MNDHANIVADRATAYHILKKELRQDWPQKHLVARKALDEQTKMLDEQWFVDVAPWFIPDELYDRGGYIERKEWWSKTDG